MTTLAEAAFEREVERTVLGRAMEKYAIPAWPYEAVYDRIIVFSVPEDKAKRGTFIPGGIIQKVETRTAKEEGESPRGVIVSAGLGARDVLRSHGMGLGHVVWVARLSPWRHEVDRDKDGKPIEFLFLRVGDVVGSETLLQYTKDGRATVECTADGGHRYVLLGDAIPRFDPPSYVA